MKIAKRDDWKTETIPSISILISVEKRYTQSEFDQISIGVIPEEMEDKWFVFYEAPWLYVHRSWTGFCIFKIRFETAAEEVEISEVWVNRDPNQYGVTDDKRDATFLLTLLDSWANRNTQSQMFNYIKNRSSNPEQIL